MKIFYILKWLRLFWFGAITICMLFLLVFICDKSTTHIQFIKQHYSASMQKMYDPEVSPYCNYNVTFDLNSNLEYTNRAVYYMPVPPEIIAKVNHFIEKYELLEKAESFNRYIAKKQRGVTCLFQNNDELTITF